MKQNKIEVNKQYVTNQLQQILLHIEFKHYFQQQLPISSGCQNSVASIQNKLKHNQLTKPEPQNHKDIQQFFHIVIQIYNEKCRLCQIQYLQSGQIPKVSPQTIKKTLSQIIARVCLTHRQLIETQVNTVMTQEKENEFYKIDSDLPQKDGYYENLNGYEFNQQGIKVFEEQLTGKPPIRHYGKFNLWASFQHYCSLIQCNRQVVRLIQIIRSHSQPAYPKLQRQTKRKSYLQFKQCAELNQQKDDFFKITLYKLNLLTFAHLVPLIQPDCECQKHCKCRIQQSIQQKIQEKMYDLYQNTKIFVSTINQIIEEDKKNLQKYRVFLEQFEKTEIIFNSMSEKESQKNQINRQKQVEVGAKKQRKEDLFCKLKQSKSLTPKSLQEQQLQKNIEDDLKRQILFENLQFEKLPFVQNEIELVKNLDIHSLNTSISAKQTKNSTQALKIQSKIKGTSNGQSKQRKQKQKLSYSDLLIELLDNRRKLRQIQSNSEIQFQESDAQFFDAISKSTIARNSIFYEDGHQQQKYSFQHYTERQIQRQYTQRIKKGRQKQKIKPNQRQIQKQGQNQRVSKKQEKRQNGQLLSPNKLFKLNKKIESNKNKIQFCLKSQQLSRQQLQLKKNKLMQQLSYQLSNQVSHSLDKQFSFSKARQMLKIEQEKMDRCLFKEKEKFPDKQKRNMYSFEDLQEQQSLQSKFRKFIHFSTLQKANEKQYFQQKLCKGKYINKDISNDDDDDNSQILDQQYLQRMQKQNLRQQRQIQEKKKKKKRKNKNKKKKNKQSGEAQCQNQNQNQASNKIVYQQLKNTQLFTKLTPEQQCIIRKISQMKINSQNRSDCFKIEENKLLQIYRRQTQKINKKSIQNSKLSPSKSGHISSCSVPSNGKGMKDKKKRKA